MFGNFLQNFGLNFPFQGADPQGGMLGPNAPDQQQPGPGADQPIAANPASQQQSAPAAASSPLASPLSPQAAPAASSAGPAQPQAAPAAGGGSPLGRTI